MDPSGICASNYEEIDDKTGMIDGNFVDLCLEGRIAIETFYIHQRIIEDKIQLQQQLFLNYYLNYNKYYVVKEVFKDVQQMIVPTLPISVRRNSLKRLWKIYSDDQ